MANLQSLTVEYVVSGSLDGTTPAPPIVTDQGADDSTPFDPENQIYRVEVENLGLIDPDLGVGGSIGARCIPFLWIDTTALGAVGASVDVVGIVEDDAKLQTEVESLVGKAGGYLADGFMVPQGSAIRLSGFTAGAEPIVVRVSILVPEGCLDFALSVLASGDDSVIVQKAGATVVPKATILNFLGKPIITEGPNGVANISITEAHCPTQIIVETADAFGPAGARVIKPNTEYVVCGAVDLGDDFVTWEAPAAGEFPGVLTGWSGFTDFLTSSTPGAVLRSTVGGRIQSCSIVATAGSAFDIAGSAPEHLFVGLLFGIRQAAASVLADLSLLAVENLVIDKSADGVALSGDIGVAYLENWVVQDNLGAPGFKALHLAAGSSTGALFVVLNAFGLTGTEEGLVVDGAASAGRINANLNLFSGPDPSLFLVGVSKTTPGAWFQGNVGVLDSEVAGGMSMSGNGPTPAGVFTVFGAINTFVAVGAGNPGTHPLFVASLGNERTTLSGLTAPVQVLNYIGLDPITRDLTACISIEAPVIGGVGFALRLLKNGAPMAEIATSNTGGLITSAGMAFLKIPAVVILPGDTFQIQISNQTNAAPVVVNYASLAIGSA